MAGGAALAVAAAPAPAGRQSPQARPRCTRMSLVRRARAIGQPRQHQRHRGVPFKMWRSLLALLYPALTGDVDLICACFQFGRRRAVPGRCCRGVLERLRRPIGVRPWGTSMHSKPCTSTAHRGQRPSMAADCRRTLPPPLAPVFDSADHPPFTSKLLITVPRRKQLQVSAVEASKSRWELVDRDKVPVAALVTCRACGGARLRSPQLLWQSCWRRLGRRPHRRSPHACARPRACVGLLIRVDGTREAGPVGSKSAAGFQPRGREQNNCCC